jgi:hypothetical protein
MWIVVSVALSYYLGGVTTLLLDEIQNEGAIQVADVVGAAVWPLGAIVLIYNKVLEYRKGI